MKSGKNMFSLIVYELTANIGGTNAVIVAIIRLFFLLKNLFARKKIGNIIDEDIIALITLIEKCTFSISLNMKAGEIMIE